jgi:ParB family chromosome partitioning protein
MKLKHIALGDLKPSDLNVRKAGTGDLAELASSIAALGILQPLLVRTHEEGFEVIAGQRRLAALNLLAEEGPSEPVPCMILEDGDDAKAIEASLAENIQRLPMDELDQYAAFADLRANGRTIEDIASHFGITERLVKQRLAIANLDDRILRLYREDAITGDTMRALTLATKSQQKAWLKRYRDPADHAPLGRQLRLWLLGGEQIATNVALFDVANYKGAIVTDLFGEESYFADASTFWAMQNEAIAAKVEAYTAKGWECVVIDQISTFPDWEYRKTTKSKGGRVYIAVTTSGEVSFHEGYLPEKEVRAREKQKEDASLQLSSAPKLKAAFTNAATNYMHLHRHAAVRGELIRHEGLALRLVTAHMIGRSGLWSVRKERGRADKPATSDSVERALSSQNFEAAKNEAFDLLGLDEDERPDQLVGLGYSGQSAGEIFARLVPMNDRDVLRLMTAAMAESLEAGTSLVNELGLMMKVDLSKLWQADDAFLDLVTSKETLLGMLEDIGGPEVALSHKASTGKTVRSVIRQYATGEGREKVERWVPAQMTFQPEAKAAEEPELSDDDEGEVRAA